MSKLIRISNQTDLNLENLKQATGKSKQSIIQEAIDMFSRTHFLEQVSQAYARLRSNPKKWKLELKEREAWDATLLDGLEDE